VAFGDNERCTASLCIGRGMRGRYYRCYWLRLITLCLVTLLTVLSKRLVLKAEDRRPIDGGLKAFEASVLYSF
jgi:hypothetical protein